VLEQPSFFSLCHVGKPYKATGPSPLSTMPMPEEFYDAVEWLRYQSRTTAPPKPAVDADTEVPCPILLGQLKEVRRVNQYLARCGHIEPTQTAKRDSHAAWWYRGHC
jgi:hypothetical protein